MILYVFFYFVANKPSLSVISKYPNLVNIQHVNHTVSDAKCGKCKMRICGSADLQIFKRVKCGWFCGFFCGRDG